MDIDHAQGVLPRKADIAAMSPVFAEIGQSVYDDWEQDEDGMDDDLGGGGICDIIADKIASVIESAYPKCMVFTSLASDEQHISVIMPVREGVINIDIPHHYYETGAGFTWRKKPECIFDGDMVAISDLDPDPRRIVLFGEDVMFLAGFQSEDNDDDDGCVNRPSNTTYESIVMAADVLDAHKDALTKAPEYTPQKKLSVSAGPG